MPRMSWLKVSTVGGAQAGFLYASNTMLRALCHAPACTSNKHKLCDMLVRAQL